MDKVMISKMSNKLNEDIVLGFAGIAMLAIGWVIMLSGSLFGAVVSIAGIIAMLSYALMTGHLTKTDTYRAWEKHTGSHRIAIIDATFVVFMIIGLVTLFII